MEWPADWDERVSGDACLLCAEGRPDDTGQAVRFYETDMVDAYLPRVGVQRGYAIVVWRASHVVEPTMLSPREALTYWREVFAVGRAMELHFRPRKMNYQTLGNATPHLHTIVSARRFDGDVSPRRPLPADASHHFPEAEVQADAAALRGILAQRSPVPTLLITGTVGVGKSTVAAEIGDVLAALTVPSAVIDLEALTVLWPPTSRWNADLMFENLAALWPNYRARGATHLVLARVIEDPGDLDRYRAAVPGAEMKVCRLVAAQATRHARLIDRMPPGPALAWHLARTEELEAILDEVASGAFTVDNDHRAARDVAVEVLLQAGWISNDQAEVVPDGSN